MNKPRTFTAEELNTLQGAGIISDLCVTSADVADKDRQRAEEYLARCNVVRTFPVKMR